ncbi:hypothetical protein [Paenibacillus koleovorans]|uniref:hypothetical protein n=1 Tax=Paenibacillus koleovorans TaxID=121608 RepID=UPI000FDA0979|nr:hypothetical protein [Paenibacillus koleovorans]
MLLAEDAVQAVSRFHTFDIFVILFTIVLAIALVRSLVAPTKNKFAIGFAGVSLLVFLVMDVLMVKYWIS